MIVNAQKVRLIFVNLKKTFQDAFKETASEWEKIAMKVGSTGKENTYTWLSRFPKLREWIGEKVVKALAAFEYTIKNKDFEATIEVHKNDIKDGDLTGQVIQAKQAGKSAKEWPEDVIYPLLSGGFNNLCYDGQPFFDKDHLVNGKSVSNRGNKRLSADSLAAAEASYGVARQTLLDMKDDEGQALKLKPCLLVVPPALESIAKTLVTTKKFSDGTVNIFNGTAEVMVVHSINNPKHWFLMDNTQYIKPFIFQEREAAEFVEQTDSSSDDTFMRGLFKFGVEARGNGGYGLWQMAYGSTGEVA